MNILVTGANGQLGTELRNVTEGSRDNYIFSDVVSSAQGQTLILDVTDLRAVRRACASLDVDVIVNCAAYTDVEKAEDNPQAAMALNAAAPANLAVAASERGAFLIHVSTDYVFSGDSTVPYREDSPTGPLGVYGATKLAGERALQSSGCDWIIIRTAWLYSPYGKNFVRTMCRLTAEKDSLPVVCDQTGSPTYAHDLAVLIVRMMDEGLEGREGIYHYSNEGEISWYDFAKAICSLCGNTCDIRPCASGEYPSKVRRPQYSVLDKTKVRETFGVEVPFWLDSLKACLERMK
ncbi:MAG: dTDP-4-dehydrorhamnose reductase [Candidatus Cryptobacteroides sp.]